MATKPDKPKRGRSENLKSWPKGVSGNPKGRPKGLTLSDAYRAKLREKFPGKNCTWAEEIAQRMAKLALKRVAAAQEMADRTEGKAPNFLEVQTPQFEGKQPIFQVNFVKPANPVDPAKPPLLSSGETVTNEVKR